jgi:hypothetical protein
MNGLTCKKFLFKRVKYILKFAKGVILTPNQREMLGSNQGCRSHGCGAARGSRETHGNGSPWPLSWEQWS